MNSLEFVVLGFRFRGLNSRFIVDIRDLFSLVLDRREISFH